jgi:hypothetical protein
MQAHLDQLELVLGHQVAAMTALKNWMPRKIELIKGHRLEELEAFTRREEEQVARLQQAESQRQVLVSMLALELGLEGGSPLSTLLAYLPEAAQDRIAAKGDALAALVVQLKQGQQEIADLLRVSLDYVHFSMDVFAQLVTAAPPTAYGYGGAAEAPPQSSASWLVDRQA